MKVKIFANSTIGELERETNEFLQTVSNVIDIKYSTSDNYSEVLIIYDETKEAAQ